MTLTTKFRDTEPVPFKVNANLTGSTYRFLCRPRYDTEAAFTTLATGVVDLTAGELEWLPTGTLPLGKYDTELEVTGPDGKIATFPNGVDGDRYELLHVIPDIA